MIEVFHYSEAGGHAENEDILDIRALSDGQNGFLCALADGQGGQAGGARAAKVACQTCMDEALKIPVADLLLPGPWIDILHKTDKEVSSDRMAGFTTLVAFCLVTDFICGGSCGDSAAILIQQDSENEILTARQSKNPPVGSGSAAFTWFAKKLPESWVVLALSDGVWKFASLQTVCKAASEKRGNEIIQSLLNKCRLPGSGALQDDFTLAVFQGSSVQIGQ